MKIQVAQSDREIESCFSVMKVLRPGLQESEFLSRVRRQESAGYALACVVDNDGTVAAVAGFRIVEFMAWGKILYLDDLATDPIKKRKGNAGALLDWLEIKAKSNDCAQMHLDSGYGRKDAHRLYLNKGFDLVSHHFSKTL